MSSCTDGSEDSFTPRTRAPSADVRTPLTPLQQIRRLWRIVDTRRHSRTPQPSTREIELERDNARLRDKIAQLSELEASARYLANHDSLTGLCNRNLLMDRFERAAAHARHCGHTIALLLFDLDGFKAVNDRYGHLAGDRLLQRVAERISTTARAGDTSCRYGGDEFIMLLPGIDSAAVARMIVRRVQEGIVDCLRMDGIEAQVSASCGVALYPDHGENWDKLMAAADAAMYCSKRIHLQHGDQHWRQRHGSRHWSRPVAADAVRKHGASVVAFPDPGPKPKASKRN